MVQLVFPPKIPNGISNSFLTIKQELVSFLKLCSSTKHLSQLHARLHLFGLQRDSFLVSELVRSLAISPAKNLVSARAIVDLYSGDSATISWNFLIRGHVSAGSSKEAIWAFRDMRRRGTRPNNLTFPFLFKACSAIVGLREGTQIMVDVFKFGLDYDVYVGNTMIHFHGSCKKISYAHKVFDEMPVRTIVSWNSVLTACVENSCFGDGIGYFVKMRESELQPNETTMVLLLSAAAELGNLSYGKLVHSQTIIGGAIPNVQLGTALVDMYAKSGNLRYAELLFGRLEVRNVRTWSAMILGLAQHGFANEALELFAKMKRSSMPPNQVTFLGVLTACSHAGLVSAARRYFCEMQSVHGISPTMVHYGAMVDVLSRAGQVNEAYEFIREMPVEPDAAAWRALLSGCGTRGFNDCDGVGEKAREALLELEPGRTGSLVMVANAYADVGMWREATEVRRVMRQGRMRKPAGESWIEVGGSVRRFLCGCDDDSQAEFESIVKLLDVLKLQMKMVDL